MATEGAIVREIVIKIAGELPPKHVGQVFVSRDPLHKYAEALLELSEFNGNHVLAELVGLVQTLIQRDVEAEDNMLMIQLQAMSKSYVLQLMQKCLKQVKKPTASGMTTRDDVNASLPEGWEARWDAAGNTVYYVDTTTNETHQRIPSASTMNGDDHAASADGSGSQESAALDDNAGLLDDSIAMMVFNVCLEVLQNQSSYMQDLLMDKAGSVIRELSRTNFFTVYNSLRDFAKDLAVTKEQDYFFLSLLQYVAMSEKRMGLLVSMLADAVAHFRRVDGFTALATHLTRAIWKWVEEAPDEIRSIYARKSHVQGADVLFDYVWVFYRKNRVKDSVKMKLWELLTALLVTCADILYNVVLQQGNMEDLQTKGAFVSKVIEVIKKARGKPGDDAAAHAAAAFFRIAVSNSETEIANFFHNQEMNLKTLLLNRKRPIMDSEGNIDQVAISNVLVASFRRDPQETSASLFTLCLSPDAPAPFRLSLVKALLIIAREDANVAKMTRKKPASESRPRSSSLSSVYTSISSFMRRLFLDNLNADTSLPGRDIEALHDDLGDISEKKRRKVRAEIMNSAAYMREETLHSLLCLFELEPQLVLKTKPRMFDDVCQLFRGVVRCLSERSMLETTDVARAASGAIRSLFRPEIIRVWGPMENNLLAFWEISNACNEAFGKVLLSNLSLRDDLAKLTLDTISAVKASENGFVRARREEEPFIIPESHYASMLKLEAGIIAHLGSGEPEVRQLSCIALGSVCDQMEALEYDFSREDVTMATNIRVYRALHRNADAVDPVPEYVFLRTVAVATEGIRDAWRARHVDWRLFTAQMSQEGRKDQIESAWRFRTGLLCALSGVLLWDDVGSVVEEPTFTAEQQADAFTSDLLKLLSVGKLEMEAVAMELIATATHPSSYATLFELLCTRLRELSANTQVNVDEGSRFAELVVEIAADIIRHAREGTDDLAYADFEGVTLEAMRFVNTFGVSSDALKMRIAQLIRLMMEHHSMVPFRREIRFKNEALVVLEDWAAHAHYEDPESPYDIEFECVDAMRLLLVDCPLEALGDGESEEENKAGFLRLFALLARKVNEGSAGRPELRDAAVKAMANVLSANIDAGMDVFVEMAYNPSMDTRKTFLSVLSNIIRKRMDFGTDEAGASSVTVGRHGELEEILFEEKFPLLGALYDVVGGSGSEADELSKVLVRIFFARDRVLELLKWAMTREVDRAQSEGTLFRANSLATKMMGYYSKMAAQDYLKKVLGPIVSEMAALGETIEVDPGRLGADPPEENRGRLLRHCKKAFASIAGSLDSMPMQIRKLCTHLLNEVQRKYPSAQHRAVGGFLFLRLMNPAMVAPESFGLAEKPPAPEERRPLTLLTKVLQNLSNEVRFGGKEAFLDFMNPFLDDHFDACKGFFEGAASLPEGESVPPTTIFFDEVQIADDLDTFYFFIHSKVDKVSQEVLKDEEAGRGRAARLRALIEKMGAPVERKKKRAMPRTQEKGDYSSTLLDDFMQRMHNEDVEEIQQRKIFVQAGQSSRGHPVFYLTPRNIDDKVDSDALMYYILKTAQPFFPKPFEIVIDAALFDPLNDMPPDWYTRFFKMLPGGARKHVAAVYVISPGLYLKKIASARLKALSTKGRAKIRFVTAPSELSDVLYPRDMESGLAAMTLDLDRDIRNTFTGVVDGSTKREVSIRLSKGMLQKLSPKEQILGHTVTMVDHFPLKGIEAAEVESSGKGEQRWLTIMYDHNGRKTLSLLTQHADAIKKAVDSAKKTVELSQNVSAFKVVEFRRFTPSDVPGTLLNLSLMHLGAPSQELRVTAYNLLVTLSETFKFSLPLQLVQASQLYVPFNSTHLVRQVSSQLARTEKHLTLEVVNEAFVHVRHLGQPYRHLLAIYLAPWLHNLPALLEEGGKDSRARVRSLLNLMVDVTRRVYDDASTDFLDNLWSVVGKYESLVDVALEVLVMYAARAGISSYDTEIVSDIVVQLATDAGQFMSEHLLERLIDVISSDVGNARITTTEQYREAQTLCRLLLMLSFDNVTLMEHSMPEVFHVVTMLMASGGEDNDSAEFRKNIHELAVNCLHTLAVRNNRMDAQERLRFLVSELTDEKYRAAFCDVSSGTVPYEAVHDVARLFMDVLYCCFDVHEEHFLALHARWFSLVSDAAFRSSPDLQPRAVIVLGAIVSPPVNNHLVRTMLSLVKLTMPQPPISPEEAELIVALLWCLRSLVMRLAPSSPFLSSMLWVAVGFVHIGDSRFWVEAMDLLSATIRTADRHGHFAEPLALEHFFMEGRQAALEVQCLELDELTGVSFRSNFAFGLVGTLLRGYYYSATRSRVRDLLLHLVEISSRRGVQRDSVAYMCGAVPLLGSDSTTIPFTGELVPDRETAVLATGILATVLRIAQTTGDPDDAVELNVFRILLSAIEQLPETFAPVFDAFFADNEQSFAAGNTEDVSRAAVDLVHGLTRKRHAAPVHVDLSRDTALKELNFRALLMPVEPIDGVSEERQRDVINHLKNVLDGLI